MTAEELAKRVSAGQRRALAKTITLIESKSAEKRKIAEDLLVRLAPLSGKSLRIGISGTPGVGKSTFIEAFGQHLLDEGCKLAILAIDPSSPIRGGSILGDRTRMEKLSSDMRVFIRPSPAGTTLGGVARHSREVILACEAAGYDTLIIETVGVGQSEAVVSSMVDVFLMLYLPNSGDELQGIKRGVLELADLVAVTKADNELKSAAARAKGQLERALMLARSPSGHLPPVHLCSALENSGISEILQSIKEFIEQQRACDAFASRRKNQAVQWFHEEIGAILRDELLNRAHFGKMLEQLETQVKQGDLPASIAAMQLIRHILPSSAQKPSAEF